jgi:hypothetical protein
MLTSHTTVDVQTETDLTTGRKAYVVKLSPLPVITPVGPAPGELRVEAEVTGRVSAITATLHPTADAARQMAEVLSRIATFALDPAALRGIGDGARPMLVFQAKPEALAGLAMTRVASAQDLAKVLDAPLLADVRSFALTDLVVEG